MTLPPVPSVVFTALGPIPVSIVEGLIEGDTDCFGYFDMLTRAISLRSGMSLEMQWATLEHELTHAALFEVGVKLDDEVEERVCNAVAACRVAGLLHALSGGNPSPCPRLVSSQ